MSRISIEVSDKMHRQIKAMAALQDMTIKEFLMERITKPAKKAPAKGKQPTPRLLRALKAVEEGRVTHYKNTEELFAEWRKEGLL